MQPDRCLATIMVGPLSPLWKGSLTQEQRPANQLPPPSPPLSPPRSPGFCCYHPSRRQPNQLGGAASPSHQHLTLIASTACGRARTGAREGGAGIAGCSRLLLQTGSGNVH